MTANDILADVWSRLAAGAAGSDHPYRNAFVATLDTTGAPTVRTVVLRAADRSAGTIDFHTDCRSSKVAQLRRDARVGWVFWDAADRVQGAGVDDVRAARRRRRRRRRLGRPFGHHARHVSHAARARYAARCPPRRRPAARRGRTRELPPRALRRHPRSNGFTSNAKDTSVPASPATTPRASSGSRRESRGGSRPSPHAFGVEHLAQLGGRFEEDRGRGLSTDIPAGLNGSRPTLTTVTASSSPDSVSSPARRAAASM